MIYSNVFKLKYGILFFRHHSVLIGIGEYRKASVGTLSEKDAIDASLTFLKKRDIFVAFR